LFPIHDENRPIIRPYVNWGLILANIVVFFLFFVQGAWALEQGIVVFGTIPSDTLSGERLWTLLTSMFMHADPMHLFGNMLYLWVFGDNIEDAFGHVKYLAFYLLSGLVASLAHIASVLATLPSYGVVGLDIPSVGASGAISAVLGAYLVLYPRARIRTVVFYFFISIVSIPAHYYLGFWFLYQLLMGVFSLTGLPSGVAFWAHIGGFVAGLVAIRAFGVEPRIRAEAGERRPVSPLIAGPGVRTPFVDVMMDEVRVMVLAELPGVEEGDIQVEVSEWTVVISAERGDIRYFRLIELPSRVIPQVVDLKYRNGVLSLTLYRSL